MNRLLKSFFGLTLGVAFSLGVAASLNSNKKDVTNTAEAAITDTDVEIRFTRPSDWGGSNPIVHTWYSEQDGVDYEMTWLSNNGYGQSVYTWSPSSSNPIRDYINIHNSGWSYQTGDRAAPTGSVFIYYDNGWQQTSVPTIDVYFYDYDNSWNGTVNVYAWRDGSSFNNTWPGKSASVTAEATNGLVYKLSISDRYNRVIFSCNGSNQTGDLTPTSNYCYVIGDLEGSNSWWDNINYVHAHNFAMNTMMLKNIPTSDQSSTAYCATRYAAAKAHMEAITSSGIGDYIINEIENSFTDALPRLAAWAKANGKTFDTSSHTFSSAHNFSMLSVSGNNGFIVVVSISALGILSVGAYYFFKKSKKAEE